MVSYASSDLGVAHLARLSSPVSGPGSEGCRDNTRFFMHMENWQWMCIPFHRHGRRLLNALLWLETQRDFVPCLTL